MSYDLQSKSWIEHNKTDILQNLSNGGLPHALLLYGTHLSGQDELAQWLATTLLCQQNSPSEPYCGQCKTCKLIEAKSHPDLQIIDNGEKNIGVDVVRQASGFLQKTAHLGSSKVVLISAVELLTEAAANALLKTLEEPTDNSYLLLVCNDIDLLLPTILSRCSLVKLQAPTGLELAKLISSPELITPFSNINQFAELTDDWVRQSFIEFEQTVLAWLTSFDDDSELLHELTTNQHALRWFANGFQQLVRMQSGWEQELSSHPLYSLQGKYQLEQIWQCINLLTQANRQIKRLTQANKTFTIEALLVDIEQVLQTK